MRTSDRTTDRRWTLGMVGLTLFALAGCGGGGDGGTNPPPVPVVTSVAVSVAAASITVGQTTTATAVARDAQGATIGGKTAAWSSGSAGVATVDAAGTVTGVAPGSAQINATIDGVVGQATVTVTPVPVASVAVTLSARNLAVGQTTQAAAVLRDQAGNALTGRATTWTSGNTAVATVNTAGLVTAVSEGKAAITATSEGRSGQDTVTVSAALSLSQFTLFTASGQPLDTSRVAGTILVRSDPSVPPGFKGTIAVRIGGVMMKRDSIFGGTSTGRVAAIVGDQLVETAQSVSTYSADQLRTVPLVGNGGTMIDQVLSGVTAGGQNISVSRQAGLTLRNVDAVRLYTAPERLTLINGRSWQSGSTNILVEDIAFSGVPIDRIEIISAPYQATYGSQAIAGVVQVLTQTTGDVGKKATVTLSGESATVGNRLIAGLITRGGITWRRGDFPSLNGSVTALDGSLLATRQSVAQTYTIPVGLTYQHVPPSTSGVLPVVFGSVDERATWYDNLAATAGLTGFAPTQRLLTVGSRAFDSNGRLGIYGNMLGNNTDLSRFVNFSDFTDNGAGFDLTASLTYYRSTSRQTLFDQASEITSVSAIQASLSPTTYLGMSFPDRAGNYGFYPAKTNTGNPTGTNGDALFGRLTSGGSTTASGFTTGMAWGKTNFGSLIPSLQLRATGSTYPANGFYGVVYTVGATKTCLEGFGAACDEPAVLGGTLSQNGTQLDYNLSLGTVKARRASLEGGTGEGIIAGAYWAADLGANWSMGGYSKMSPFRALIDDTPPNAFLSATFPSPGNVSVTARLTDNFATAVGHIGVRFNYSSSLFLGGKLYAPIDEFPIGGDLQTGLTTDASVAFNAPIISTGRFFDRISGQVTSSTFLSDGAYFAGWDYARNPVRTFLSYNNPGPAEGIPADLQQVFYSLSGTQVCNGAACAGGVPTSVNMFVDAVTSTSTPPFAKASFVLIPPDGVVEYAGKDVTPVTTQVGATYRHRYELAFSPATSCMRALFYLAKVMLLTATGTQALFPNSFPSLSLVAPSSGGNQCSYPPRDIRF